MDFTLTDLQRAWQLNGQSLGRELGVDSSAADVIAAAARAGLVERNPDLLAAAVAVEAVAWESAGAAIALALHAGVLNGLADNAQAAALARGEIVGAIALSSDDVPSDEGGRLMGRASWVAPLTGNGLAIVGMRSGDGLVAAAVLLDAPGITQEPAGAAGLHGLVCGHLRFEMTPFTSAGPTQPFMSRARVLLAAAGVGMGRRALHEALAVARGKTGHGAGGEQTVQGLLADAATELDAARMLLWKAASAETLSLGDASMAKLASTEATQRAVARATQVVGADSFRAGHILDRLSQDVRALELFAGRTEALREAVAMETLPRT
ncbi:MAG TPA: acyl-CoA dehydrogenase family protein [Vicinamibacterales bacterium]|nr:acyl-CoA dehydrogenase family protein [Vicinamibacterales bacterium]